MKRKPEQGAIMRADRGCGVTDGHLSDDGRRHAIEVLEDLWHENDRQADRNRARFDGMGVLAVNLVSGSGSGKTSLLEATIKALPTGLRVAVVEGDPETENDAERIRRHGVPAVQITTGMACHLDAHMVHEALQEIDLARIDILFIENVGNLVCPASFDIGQHADVLLLSVTEGDDKPAKYPAMVSAADRMLITKTDLLPYIEEFSIERARAAARAIRSDLPIVALSAKNGSGLNGWLEWLVAATAKQRAWSRPASGT
jgi:hydrogenase nickel incorporation protein HypB